MEGASSEGQAGDRQAPRSRAAHLEPYWWPRGKSGGGHLHKKPKRPITEALERLLEKRPELLDALARRWLNMAARDPHALREMLLRLEGRVPILPPVDPPRLELVVQPIHRRERPAGQADPTPKNGAAKNGKAHLVEEVEATPLDEEDAAVLEALEDELEDDE